MILVRLEADEAVKSEFPRMGRSGRYNWFKRFLGFHANSLALRS